jgi:predicted ATP-binding protein involved in virulence
MYIKNIKLTNYRNYENINLEFGKMTTILIGKNGMGKTNLITALKQSLSFIFTKSKRISQSNFIANTIQGGVQKFKTTDATRKFNEDGTQSKEGSFPIDIETTIVLDDKKTLNVVFRKENMYGMKELYAKEAICFWEHYDTLQNLPILAFYSDSFPHEKMSMGQKIQDLLKSEFGIAQSAGYYNWNDPRDCGLVWQWYFVMQWKTDKYGHSKNNEKAYLNAVGECIKKFAEPLKDSVKNEDFEITEMSVVSRGNKDVIVFRFKNGVESDFESLPAGYRRVFSIAFDLANRSFLLNNNCNSNGVCFIDEIDLHLHPSLAQEILDRLRYTFPNIQFIASTHSPVVLSNFKQDENNIVYQLGRENRLTICKKLPNSYGIDYNSLLENQMESPVRNSLLSELVNAYNYWKGVGDVVRMDKVINLIINKVGEESELVKNLLK